MSSDFPAWKGFAPSLYAVPVRHPKLGYQSLFCLRKRLSASPDRNKKPWRPGGAGGWLQSTCLLPREKGERQGVREATARACVGGGRSGRVYTDLQTTAWRGPRRMLRAPTFQAGAGFSTSLKPAHFQKLGPRPLHLTSPWTDFPAHDPAGHQNPTTSWGLGSPVPSRSCPGV